MLNNIEAERVRNRLTKEELAKWLGVSPKTYYNWVNEETDVPSSALLKMSRMFKTNIDYLLEGCTGVPGSKVITTVTTGIAAKMKDKTQRIMFTVIEISIVYILLSYVLGRCNSL